MLDAPTTHMSTEEVHPHVLEAYLKRLRIDFDDYRRDDTVFKNGLITRITNLENLLARYEGKLGGVVLFATLLGAGVSFVLVFFKAEISRLFH